MKRVHQVIAQEKENVPPRLPSKRRKVVPDGFVASPSQEESSTVPESIVKNPPANGHQYMPQEVLHIFATTLKAKHRPLQEYMVQNKLVGVKDSRSIRKLLKKYRDNPSRAPKCWGRAGRKKIYDEVELAENMKCKLRESPGSSITRKDVRAALIERRESDLEAKGLVPLTQRREITTRF